MWGKFGNVHFRTMYLAERNRVREMPVVVDAHFDLHYRSLSMLVDRIRKICLSLPEAYEEETWNTATFRFRKKIFAMAADHDGGSTVCMKADRDEQQALLNQGEPFFYPAYVGPKGWIGVDLRSENADWGAVDELIRESYRLVAPKRLASSINQA